MVTEELIPAAEFCKYHHVQLTFIHSLYQSGLVQVVYQEEEMFVPINEMPHLEKLVRMHYDMDINLEGIETICHLLQKIEQMQQHIAHLNNQLNLQSQQIAAG